MLLKAVTVTIAILSSIKIDSKRKLDILHYKSPTSLRIKHLEFSKSSIL